VQLSVENRMGGDSNVFRRNSGRVDDGFYSLSPRVAIRETHSKLNYDFHYQPTYETYFESSGIDGFDHRAKGTLSWRPTAVDTIGLSGEFASIRNPIIEGQGGSFVETSDRERIKRSDAQLAYSRSLNDVLSLQASAVFTNLDFSQNSSVDSRSYTGQLGTQYVLNPITIVGLSASFRRREDRGVGFQYETETDIWDVGASFKRSLARTLSLSASAGPSFIRSRQKPPPASALPEDKSRSTSYFAVVVLEKDWQRSNLSASYTRSESSGGGTASSSIVDNVGLDFTHYFSQKLSVRVEGTWLKSKEINEVARASKRETQQFRVTSSMTKRITGQLSVKGQFMYFNQDENGGTTGSQSIGDVYVGFVSLRYTFDPIAF
jgi:predicted porin